MKRFLLVVGLIMPLQVAALEFRNLSLLYTDAPFIPAEEAGISLLTSINAVSGYPDGSFKPTRTLNRAEFLKIALSSYPKVRVSSSDADNCFPDVRRDDWFAQYVCLAKKRGIIGGYPDGEFKPGQTVNYAEALKILGELYEYVAYSAPDEEWFAGYVRAAEFNKTALPASIAYDRALTRGQMARLAAAFRAQYEGELDTYRLSERNFDLVIAQEIAEKKQQSSSSSVSSVSSSAASSVASSTAPIELPAKSRFLLLGTEQIIASGYFVPRDELAKIENVTMKFREEVKNIKSLYLVSQSGDVIATFTKDIVDVNELTWKAQGSAVAHHLLPASGEQLALKALMKNTEEGHSEELIQVKWMSMNVRAVVSEQQYQLIASQVAYPAHQTSRAHITVVRNNRPPVLDLGDGDGVLLAEFEVEGEALDNAPLSIDDLVFTMHRDGVSVDNLVLGVSHDTVTIQCSLGNGNLISCNNIPASIGYMERGAVLFQLWGSVTVNPAAGNPTLQIDLEKPGVLSTSTDPGELGHILWSDGTGNFKWVDLPEPLAEGSVWK